MGHGLIRAVLVLGALGAVVLVVGVLALIAVLFLLVGGVL